MKDMAVMIRGIRKREGYSIKELSKALNISTKTIGDIEYGRKFPNKALIKKLCQVLNTNIINFSE